MELKFWWQIHFGKVIWDNPRDVIAYCEMLEWKDIIISIKEKTKNRSIKQNSYYWGHILTTLWKEFWYTVEEMHEVLKYKFLLIHDEKFTRLWTTKELSTVQFEEYLSKIRIWASKEYNIYLCEPNEF